MRSVDGMARPSRAKRNYGSTIVIVLLLLIIVGMAWYITAKVGLSSVNENEFDHENASANAIVERVSELIVLPDDEDPTVATVTNPDDLRGQPFFENAKAGHKVLMYTQAQKAILYDPQLHKLIEVAPISIDVFE